MLHANLSRLEDIVIDGKMEDYVFAKFAAIVSLPTDPNLLWYILNKDNSLSL